MTAKSIILINFVYHSPEVPGLAGRADAGGGFPVSVELGRAWPVAGTEAAKFKTKISMVLKGKGHGFKIRILTKTQILSAGFLLL